VNENITYTVLVKTSRHSKCTSVHMHYTCCILTAVIVTQFVSWVDNINISLTGM